MARKLLILTFGAVLSLLVPRCFADGAADVNVASFPISVQIDQSYHVQSSMYLKCNYITYRQSFDSFSKIASGASESRFKEIIVSICADDLPQVSRGSTRTSNLAEKEFAEIVGSCKKMIENPDLGYDISRMIVLKQIYLGSNRLFIWDMPAFPQKGSPGLIRSFKFIPDNQNSYLWDLSHDKVAVILTHSIEKMEELPETVRLAPDGAFDFEYQISGSDSNNPVYLQFNGKKYNLDILAGEVDNADEIALFYQRTCRAFKKDGSLNHASFYTPQSRQKYLAWVSEMTDKQNVAYKNDTIDIGRTLLFIIDADPVYLVFYKFNNNNAKINYDYIVRDPADGQLKLTNFYIETYLDDLIRDRKLFYDSILKQRILQQD